MSAKAASSQRKDPYPNYHFQVEINGITQIGFCEVIMPDSANEVIEYRDGQESTTAARKQAGRLTFGVLILKCGLTSSMELYNWRKQVETGKLTQLRKDITISLLDEEHKSVAQWKFSNAWPSKYKGPDMNAVGNEIAIETFEIAFESMQRVQ